MRETIYASVSTQKQSSSDKRVYRLYQLAAKRLLFINKIVSEANGL